MKRLISAIKKIRLSQVLAVFLAGVLMLSTAACSGSAQARDNVGGQSRDSNSSAQGIPGHRQQNYKGGMNGYSDVDARYNKGVQAKSAAQAKGLVDNAERNVIDQTDDVGTNTKRILDKKGENLDQFGSNLKQDTRSLDNKAGRTTSNLSDSAERGSRNLAGNTKRAADEVTQNTQHVLEKATSAPSRDRA